MEAGKPLKRMFPESRGGGENACTSCFVLFQTPGMKCTSEYFKAMVPACQWVVQSESGQKQHSFSPKITQAFCGRDRGHTNFFCQVFKGQGDLFWKKERQGHSRQGIIPAEAKVSRVPAVPRRTERITGSCYKDLRLPYSLRNFCPVISLDIGFSLENS